jgi:hypothetical protein
MGLVVDRESCPFSMGRCCPWCELSMVRVLYGTSCPSCELSMVRDLYGTSCPWGEFFHDARGHGARCRREELAVGRVARAPSDSKISHRFGFFKIVRYVERQLKKLSDLH